MKNLLEFAVRLLVNDKEAVEVRQINDPMGTFEKYHIKVSGPDTRVIIGKEGKTIKAIRSLVSMACINKGIKKKIPVEIVEN
ncbi:MAG TPA: KH domain-containing protein [bacterium]|nr:KH domain-containing protein [bacterium]